MEDWLEDARHRLERRSADVGDLTLSGADVDRLLELARRAAHESGERTNAPLVSYLVGLAVGRGGLTLDQAIESSLGRDDAP